MTEMAQELKLSFRRAWWTELINHHTFPHEPGQASESFVEQCFRQSSSHLELAPEMNIL